MTISNISLQCNKNFAYDSLDYKFPYGSRRDNSVNYRFNKKLYNLYDRNKILKILDLGCAGGGFVRSCIDSGNFAIGLEGSDFPKKNRQSEWRTIPECLFNCDVKLPFQLFSEKVPLKFDVITAWELLEHIEEKDLDTLIGNIKKHLTKGGLGIFSIAAYGYDKDHIAYHRTIKYKDWWVKKFNERGLYHVDNIEKYFNSQYVRGKFETKEKFHLIVTNDLDKVVTPSKIKFRDNILDKWIGTRSQIYLKKILIGDTDIYG